MPPTSFYSALESIGKEEYWLLDFAWLWKNWWKDKAEDDQISEICAWTNNQEACETDIQAWANTKWPAYPQVADGLLYQLSSQEPFTGWSDVRQDRLARNPTAIYGVGIPDGSEGNRDDIWQPRVFLIPRLGQKSDHRVAEALNFDLSDEAANKAPAMVFQALTATLKDCRFWLWFLREGWKQTSLEKWLIRVLSFVSLGLFLLFLFIPKELLVVERDWEIAQGVQAFIWCVGGLFAVLAGAAIRHRWAVRWDLKNWLPLLDQGAILMVTSPELKYPIKGSSYGVTLALSLLLALDKSRPAKSAFFRASIARIKTSSATWLFTGDVKPDGRIGPVDYLIQKLNALLDFNEKEPRPLTVLARPLEDSPSETIVESSSGLAITKAAEAVIYAGSPRLNPGIRRYSTLCELVFEVRAWREDWRKYIAGSLLMAASVGLAIMAVWAALDLRWILDPPQVKGASMLLGASSQDTEASASITIYSANPNLFTAKVRSDYWQSCVLPRFPWSVGPDDGATIKFNLLKSPTARIELGVLQGAVELIRLRSLLWCDLPAEENIFNRTFSDLISSGKIRSEK